MLSLEELQSDLEQVESAINYVNDIQSKYFEEEKEEIQESLESLKAKIEEEINGIEAHNRKQFEREFPPYQREDY